MNEGIYHADQFKSEAFRWHAVFTKRQTKVYPLENIRLIRDETSKYQIIDKFVDNRCNKDTGRYLSRRLLLGSFLKSSDIVFF